MLKREDATKVKTRPDRELNQVYMREQAFSEEECRVIREIGETLKREGNLPESGTFTADGDDAMSDYRQAASQFMMPDRDNRWIFQRLHDLLIPVNNAVYQFHLAGFEQGVQISEYPVGNGYGWHVDIGHHMAIRRKLSMTVQLSSPDEYDGGELEFMIPTLSADRRIGSLCVFPSWMLHRVRPITRGRRWSLVSWICGEPYH
jgi:PKHD-type hydroxylase